MKKQIFIYAAVIVAILFSSQAFAQISFGVKGGINSASVTGKPENFDSKGGISVGVVGYSSLDEPLFFQSGLLFSQKGGKKDGLKHTFNYLELPVNVGYSLPVGNFLKIAPYVGPYLAYALSGKSKFGGVSVDVFKDTEGLTSIGSSKKGNRFDIGGNLGVGLHFKEIVVSAQYTLGLVNVIPSTRNRGVNFGVTYLFKK